MANVVSRQTVETSARQHFGDLGDKAVRMVVEIGRLESGYDTTAHNTRGSDDSYGIMQINMKGDLANSPARRPYAGNRTALYNVDTNIRVARGVYEEAVSYGWWGWKPWSTSAAAAAVIAGVSSGGSGDGGPLSDAEMERINTILGGNYKPLTNMMKQAVVREFLRAIDAGTWPPNQPLPLLTVKWSTARPSEADIALVRRYAGVFREQENVGENDIQVLDAHNFKGQMQVVRRMPDTNYGPTSGSDHNSILSLLYAMQESNAYFPNEVSQVDVIRSV